MSGAKGTSRIRSPHQKASLSIQPASRDPMRSLRPCVSSPMRRPSARPPQHPVTERRMLQCPDLGIYRRLPSLVGVPGPCNTRFVLLSLVAWRVSVASPAGPAARQARSSRTRLSPTATRQGAGAHTCSTRFGNQPDQVKDVLTSSARRSSNSLSARHALPVGGGHRGAACGRGQARQIHQRSGGNQRGANGEGTPKAV